MKVKDPQRPRPRAATTRLTLATRTLGPVPDLERHLPSDWWRRLFNSVYIKTDGDVVENDANTQRDVDLLVAAAGIAPAHRVLDLCCGQGRHSLELARRGFEQVVGVDRSRYLIRLAKKRARTAGLSVRFHEGDARKFRYKGQPFDCVALMGNSFGYFEQRADDEAVLETVKANLRARGTLLLDISDGDWMRARFAPRSWEWIDDDHFVCRERALSSDGDRLVSREVVVHAEKGVIADQFYAERLYSREQITALLARRGFGDVALHDGAETASDRNQDLGMMAHRLFLTARAPEKKAAAPPAPRVAYPQVTVILGDPRLADVVKLGGKFNPEDFDTLTRLREALAELKDYAFTFLDDHQTLLSQVRAAPPPFVFNLCDEGFKNDPLRELHLPALLEMFDVPYTGAGPACLGLCYNKALVRAIAQSLDVPVPAESFFGADDSAATIPATFPALVKPNCGDSSMGITKDAVVRDTASLLAYIDWLRERYGRRAILVQEFLTGPEYTVAIVGNPGLTLRVLPPLEVDYGKLPAGLPPLLSYESKWQPDSPYWTDIAYHEARLDEDRKRLLVDYSVTLFERLGCRDYARFDYRADAQGAIKLLEANPNPGWCWDGKLNLMAGYAGLSYADLLRLILEAAQERVSAGVAKAPLP
ncbi:MAG: methyltransferase domain-containing protein [Planctomycetes bacterium]|nr:methyltransferase domain-containing protein [Planctomycetota bacterium]